MKCRILGTNFLLKLFYTGIYFDNEGQMAFIIRIYRNGYFAVTSPNVPFIVSIN